MPVTHHEMMWKCRACDSNVWGRFKRCQNCGKEIEAGQDWFDPPEGEAPPLTDPELIKQATEGADWHCPFCNSSQRNSHGECRECGASREEIESGERLPDTKPEPRRQYTPPTRPRRTTPRPRRAPVRHSYDWDTEGSFSSVAENRIPWKIIIPAGIGLLIVGFILLFVFYERTAQVEVSKVNWVHTVHVDRYQVVHDEGFDESIPQGAFNVKSLYMKHHHYKQVPDGYRTEHYTVQEACGQNCRTTPRSCSTNSNGFKTCTGGDRVCSTKYCTRNKTKQVQKYKDVSVKEMWYSWDVWKWKHNRSIPVSGESTDTSWPSDKLVCLNCNLKMEGEKERARREGKYLVTFSDNEDTYTHKPKSEAEFRKFPIGNKRTIIVNLFGQFRRLVLAEQE